MADGVAARPRVGISACLLGERTRYDGDHRIAPHIFENLGPELEWVAVCPEVEAGFGVPRETLRLEGDSGAPRLVTTETRRDRTDLMRRWARSRVGRLRELDLAGFVLKRNSPSCGISGVKLFPPGGSGDPGMAGVGLFVLALREELPGLPMADEEMLRDRQFAAEFLRQIQERHARLRG